MRRVWIFIFGLSACQCPGNDPLEFDPLCESCRLDGDSCGVSFNCQKGSICNEDDEDLYDPNKPGEICIRVACSTDADCEPPRVCTLARVCEAPVCQNNADCTEQTVCVGGACEPVPSISDVVRCAIVTPHLALESGGSSELHAVALDANGRVVPLAAFTWSSSDDQTATISGSTVIAANEGEATISATIGDTSCTGLSIRTFAPLAAGMTRVVISDEKTGAPIAGAVVTIGAETSTTDAAGKIEFASTATIAAVTVVKTGWRSVTVLEPGTNDLFLVLSRSFDFTKAGGLRGSVGLGPTRPADLKVAIVASARSLDLFEYRAVPTADIVPTLINYPELNLNNALAPLPGNLALGMGNAQFTRDETRCRELDPPSEHLGCFLTRMPEGRSAAWVMGGQVKISEITPIAGEDFAVENEGEFNTKDRTRLLMILSPLARSMYFGALPYLEVESSPRVPRERSTPVDCSDPAQAVACRADFDRYQRIDPELVAAPSLHTVIDAPILPSLPEQRCAGAMVVSSYAILPGRGLMLLGLATAKASAPSCIVEGSAKPFGDQSKPVGRGQIALSTAPLHSGLEGNKRVLIAASVDVDEGETRSLDLNLLIEPLDHLGPSHDLSTRSFLPYPQATLDRDAATLLFTQPSPSSGTRLAIESADGGWIIYAPPGRTSWSLPDVDTPRAVLLGAQIGTLQSFELDSAYTDLWSLGSSERIDRSIEHLRAVATTECSRTAPCKIE